MSLLCFFFLSLLGYFHDLKHFFFLLKYLATLFMECLVLLPDTEENCFISSKMCFCKFELMSK